ncbi:MAG: hypothetical protein Tsb0033_02190 [Winogradskyella sp.]
MIKDKTVKKIPNFLYSLKNDKKDILKPSKVKKGKGTIQANLLELF